MTDETRSARLEGIRVKLSEGYGLTISDITWLGEQLEGAWAVIDELEQQNYGQGE